MSAASATSPRVDAGCSCSEVGPAGMSAMLPTASAFWPATLFSTLREFTGSVWNSLRQNRALPALRKRPRRLRVSETISLGDKRFVYLLEVDGKSLLIGSSGASIALLAHLSPREATEQEQGPLGFEGLLRQSLERDEVR